MSDHTLTVPRFRLGRRTPKNAPALRLASFLTGELPAPPTAVDYGSEFSGWQVLGNDVAGDCVAVTWANQRALVTTALNGQTSYPDQAEVWSLYQTQNPRFDPNGGPTTNGPHSSADNGTDIQTALEYLVNTGGPDGVKAVAFARVDYTNEAELRAAHAIFGQVWYGLTVTWANQHEFNASETWDWVADSGIDGGHSVTGVGYDPTDYKFITWGQETAWTEALRTHQVDEAWVVIWPEHLGNAEFEVGIDLGQLAGAYLEVTGQPLHIRGWQGWSPIPAGIFTQGTPVAAVTRHADQLDIYAVGEDGRMYTAWWNTTDPWSGWQPFVQPGTFNQRTPVAAVSRNPNQLDFFAVGEDGQVYTAWWNATGGPGGWSPIPAGIFTQGTPIAVVSRNPNQLDIYAVGEDGRMYTAWWNPTNGWSGCQPFVQPGTFNQRTPVAAVSRNPNQLDFFAVGEDGQVYTAWWNATGGPGGWSPIPAGIFNQGTPIAVVSRNPDQLDVFAVGEDGRMYTTWWNPTNGWGGWAPIQSGVFNQGTPVAVVSRNPNQLDVFAVGQDGAMYTAWWNPTNGWGGWAPVRRGAFDQGTPVAAVITSPDAMSVFALGQDGVMKTAWWGWLG